MKYLLKSKSYSLLDFVYERHEASQNRMLFFSDEKEILDFFSFAIDEEIASTTANMDIQDNSWQYGGVAMMQTALQISNTKISFRDMLKNKFSWFKDMYSSNNPSTKPWHARWKVKQMKCNPNNYKIFSMASKEVRGRKFNIVNELTWFEFYKQCVAIGLKPDELVISSKT